MTTVRANGSASKTNISNFTPLGLSGVTGLPRCQPSHFFVRPVKRHGRPVVAAAGACDKFAAQNMDANRTRAITQRAARFAFSASARGRLLYSMTTAVPAHQDKMPDLSAVSRLGVIFEDIPSRLKDEIQ